MSSDDVTVIIAAFNARATIASAIGSALAEGEVGEVIVVDDCSTDDTVQTAREAANGDPRLRILRQEANGGPAAARNRAIDEATRPFLAILDSDDKFLPGRFARLFAGGGWDLCADNIVFSTNRQAFDEMSGDPAGGGRVAQIDLAAFLAGNRNTGKVQRAELGFLKPVMRREFLDRCGLRYATRCRLGEDFILYAKALAAGARFHVHEACGYAAFERPDSLSGQHTADDLRSYLAELDAMEPVIPSDAQTPYRELRQSMRDKIAHRDVLNIRNERGLLHGLSAMARHPTTLRDIVRDKLAGAKPDFDRRLLLTPQAFDGLIA